MFIQIVTGTVPDADTFRRAGEAWERDVRPTVEGYLGGTVGVTADNTFIVCGRFESKEAAARNNDNPAQQAWYAEHSASMTDVQYFDCSRVVLLSGGGSDEAGFVQVMVGRVKDRARFDALSERADELSDIFRQWRNDVFGDVIAVHDDDDGYHDIVYFRSEAEARVNEQKEPPAAMQAVMAEMSAAAEVVAFLDLTDPILT